MTTKLGSIFTTDENVVAQFESKLDLWSNYFSLSLSREV